MIATALAVLGCSSVGLTDFGGSAPSRDTAEDVDAIESIPTGEYTPPADGLCQLTLACPDEVSADARTACTFSVATVSGVVNYAGDADVWLRGRSSRTVPKHQYAVELRKAGQPLRANLLGMGGESDWVLNGLWFDRLLLRNKLAFDLYQSFSPERYAPESRMCELTLDGDYVGVYALAERIKRDDDRVDVAAHDAFVMVQTDHECFHPNATTYGCYKLRSPDEDAISPDDASIIDGFLDAWEATTLGAHPYDESTGVFAYVDMASAVDIVLLEELMKNEDAWYTSMHIWKDAGGKVNFSPWDLDMTFGVLEYYSGGDYGNPRKWIEYRPTQMGVIDASPAFRSALAARWAELRGGVLAAEAIFARLDEQQALLGDSIARNFDRWPIGDINYGTCFYPVNSYAEEDAHVRAWITTRLEFMDENIGGY